MPTALEELYTTLTAACQNGDLTLTTQNAGAPEIGGFIAGLTGQCVDAAAVQPSAQRPAAAGPPWSFQGR